MPMPMEYKNASEDFERFLKDALDISALTTRNQVYTMVQAVFCVFRRRLDIDDALRFADVLPPVLRAIFVSDWSASEPRRPFESLGAMTKEAQSFRGEHNFSPDTCIRDVAAALRKNVDKAAFERVLASLPAEAAAFWRA